MAPIINIVLPQPAQLPQEFQSWTAVRPHRWCLAGFRCFVFCCPRNPDAIHWHEKTKNAMNLHYSKSIVISWPRWNSHQAGQGACTNYSLKRTKERGLRCTGSHSHGQEHGHIGWQAMWFPWFSMVHKLWKHCSKYSKPHDPKQTPYVYGAFSSPPLPHPMVMGPYIFSIPPIPPTYSHGLHRSTHQLWWTQTWQVNCVPKRASCFFPFWCFAKSACRCIYNHIYIHIYNNHVLYMYTWIYLGQNIFSSKFPVLQHWLLNHSKTATWWKSKAPAYSQGTLRQRAMVTDRESPPKSAKHQIGILGPDPTHTLVWVVWVIWVEFIWIY